MRNATVLLLVVALAMGACSRHPTYGQPAPRDTMPTTKAPGSPEPKMDPPPK
jgi:hypothetical protein